MSLAIRLLLVMAAVAFQTNTAERSLIGVDVIKASARLQISLKEWRPLKVKPYEAACDAEHKTLLYGQEFFVCIIRKEDKVAALEFSAYKCDGKCYQQLLDRISEAYMLERSGDKDIYVIARGGNVLRLNLESDETARFTLTDGEFGKVYADELLGAGLRDLVIKLRPH